MKDFAEICKDNRIGDVILPIMDEKTGKFGGSASVWIHERDSVTRLSVAFSSDEGGLEHVSVSLRDRTPTWEEMCVVKDIFWKDEERCIQIHPKKSEYVNIHSHCLHIWRPKNAPEGWPF